MKLKKLLIISSLMLTFNCLSACSLPVANITGEQVLSKGSAESQTLVVQSNVSMDDNNINSLTGGKIAEVFVKEGDTVEAGQVLITIDSDSILAQKSQSLASIETVKASIAAAQAGKKAAEAQLQQAKNGAREEELNQVKIALDSAQDNYDRVKALYDAGASTKADLDGVEAALKIAQNKYELTKKGATDESIHALEATVEQASAGIAAAEGQLKQAEAGLEQINVALQNTVLTSPVTGIITSLNVKAADMVSSGMPLAVVTETAHPTITCSVKETDLSKVDLNQEVKIKLPAYEDTEITGTVSKINKNADFATKRATNDNGEFDILSYGVKVEFNDLESLELMLRAGMTAFVDFQK